MLPLSFAWKNEAGDVSYQSMDLSTALWQSTDLVHGVLYSNQVSAPQTLILQNMAQDRRLALSAQDGTILPRAETLSNVRLYLTIGDAETKTALLEDWPGQGGGVQLSFDRGSSWMTVSSAAGNPDDPSTWIPLPAGEIGPFPPDNRAVIQVRLNIPPRITFYGPYLFGLCADVTVL